MAETRFEDVSKRYGGVDAVKALSLTCPQGEMLALLGPSGCGKSTTLKMVAGVERPSAGEIYFDGRPVSALSPGARNIAMVFEDYALYPHMTVAQNVGFPLSVAGLSKARIDEQVATVLDLLDLTRLADRGVRELSGGAQQRVSIGRALVRKPELILFDEPLSHLDGDQKVQLRSEIKRLQTGARLTSILVTHDQSEAVAMADRVAVMNHGVLQQVDTPADIYARPANMFVAAFIGEPPMNLLPVRAAQRGPGDEPRLTGNGWQVDLVGDRGRRLAGAIGSAPLTVGVRPEDVAVTVDGGGYARGRIAFVEPRGDADIITVSVVADDGTESRIVSERPGPSGFAEGMEVGVELPAHCLHLFESEGGANLLDRAA